MPLYFSIRFPAHAVFPAFPFSQKSHLKEPIPVDIKTVIEMKQMSDYLEMRFEDYFGNIELDVNNYHSVYKAIEKRSLKERSMYSEKSKTRIPGRLFVGRCNRG